MRKELGVLSVILALLLAGCGGSDHPQPPPPPPPTHQLTARDVEQSLTSFKDRMAQANPGSLPARNAPALPTAARCQRIDAHEFACRVTVDGRIERTVVKVIETGDRCPQLSMQLHKAALGFYGCTKR
jgi:hypothetical protein